MGIPHPFPQSPSTVCGARPYAIIQPLVHQRGCAWGGHPGFNCQGCGGACSASLPRLLQPSVFGVENLGVVASGHQSLDPQSLRGCVTFPDGDHSVCPAFSSSGRLMASIDLKEAYLQVPIHPESRPFLRFVAQGRVYQFTALCFGLHGSAGFLPGHGSCFRHSPFLGYQYASIPRRLASQDVLRGVSPSGPPGGAGPLSGVGHCEQPGEIQPRALSGCSVSRGDHQCPNFCGFSIARMHLQSSVNSWRISFLRRSSRQYLALAAWHAVLTGSSRPWRTAPLEVPPTVSPPVLGSGGSVNPDSLVSRLSSGSAVVAPLTPPLSGGVSTSGVSRHGLLV